MKSKTLQKILLFVFPSKKHSAYAMGCGEVIFENDKKEIYIDLRMIHPRLRLMAEIAIGIKQLIMWIWGKLFKK